MERGCVAREKGYGEKDGNETEDEGFFRTNFQQGTELLGRNSISSKTKTYSY